MKLTESTLAYLKCWFGEVPEGLKNKLEKHAKKYNLEPEICAIYKDMDDFYSDWCGAVGFTKEQARYLYDTNEEHQFKRCKGYGIFRFVV